MLTIEQSVQLSETLTLKEIEFAQYVEQIKIENPTASEEELLTLIDWKKDYSPVPLTRGRSVSTLKAELSKLNSTEKALLLIAPKEALLVRSAANLADKWTNEYYPHWTDGDKGNAYRHAMWNAFMVHLLMSRTKAKAWANAHEVASASALASKWNGFTGKQHRSMDYNNNSQGRASIKWWEIFIKESTIHNRVSKRIKEGKMIILVK
jgi:hypothetical protein